MIKFRLVIIDLFKDVVVPLIVREKLMDLQSVLSDLYVRTDFHQDSGLPQTSTYPLIRYNLPFFGLFSLVSIFKVILDFCSVYSVPFKFDLCIFEIFEILIHLPLLLIRLAGRFEHAMMTCKRPGRLVQTNYAFKGGGFVLESGPSSKRNLQLLGLIVF